MSQESYHRHAFLLRFTHILFSKSIPNFNAIMPSNRAGPYDHNGTTFNSIPILEGEIRNLPGFCLPILSGQRRRFRARIIYRRKGLLNWNTAPLRSWESAQWLWRYSGIKLDRIISWVWKAPSYFPHIFSSTLWNPIEFDIYGKLFSRGIQPFTYHGLKISFHGGRQQLPELHHPDQLVNIGIFQIRPLFPLCVPFLRVRSPSVLSHWEWDLGHFEVEIWVWIVGFRGFGIFYYWKGLVGLSFTCKRLLNVESLEFIDCDGLFFLYTLYQHVC